MTAENGDSEQISHTRAATFRCPLRQSNSLTIVLSAAMTPAKSWELAIAHTLHLSRTREPEILYTLPRVARGSGMPLVTVAF